MALGRLIAVVAIAAVVAVGCGADPDLEGSGSTPTSTTEPGPQLTFYRPPTVLDDVRPGQLLDMTDAPIDPSWPGTGMRIRFVSTTPAGDHVPVTGMVLRPDRPPPAGGYPIVVWAHGSVGLGDPCAPSRVEPFQAPGARSDVVVVKDAEAVRLAREEWCTASLTPPRPLDQIFLEDPDNEPAWREAVAENTPRADDLGIPVLFTHGDADGLVPISGTVSFHDEHCRADEHVLFLRDPTWVHASAWTAPLDAIVQWIEARFAGTAAPTDCE